VSDTPVEPTLADFRMAIDKGLPVMGLKDPTKSIAAGYVELEGLTDEDVPEVPFVPASSQNLPWEKRSVSNGESKPTASRRPFGIIALNVAFLVILLAALFRQFRRRR
jgi:hypothetical protein